MHNETTRSQQHAKLLTFEGRQALVFLQRDSDEKLVVLVQIWSDAADHQVRALIDAGDDDRAMVAFDAITDDTLPEFLESTGLGTV